MPISKRKYNLKKKKIISKKNQQKGGNLNIGIVITIYKRFEYLNLLLKSLKDCNLNNTIICFVDDFSNDIDITNLLNKL